MFAIEAPARVDDLEQVGFEPHVHPQACESVLAFVGAHSLGPVDAVVDQVDNRRRKLDVSGEHLDEEPLLWARIDTSGTDISNHEPGGYC